MQIKYPSWLPKFIGSNQTPQEMNQVIDVIQNHAENLSRHYRLILTNVGGIYPDIILPNSPFPEGITQAVFLVGPGTYVNFGNVVVPNNNVGLIFYYDETFDLSLVPLETYDDTPLRNRVTALEDKNGGEIAEGNNKNVTGGQVHSALQSMETGGAKNLLDLEDVDATQIPDGNFLVGKAGQKTEFRKLHAKDVRIGAGYQSGEYVVTWNYRTNNWGSGTLVTTSSIENSIAKRDARGRLIAEAGTGEKHLVNYGQLPFKLFETENEAQSYLLGGLAKYGQLIFLQSGPQKGRMLQVNETLDGYNTLFDYELNLSSLLDLNDFPNAYTDAAGKVLIVNPTSSGIQFKSINEIDGIATYDNNGNLTATEATTNENVPTLGQVVRMIEQIETGGIDLTTYATKTWVEDRGYITITSLIDFATQSWVNNQGYALTSQIVGLASQTWVENKGYVTGNIYTSNGTLTSNRDVSLNGFKLNFSGGITKIDTLELGQKTSNLLPRVLFTNGTDVRFTDENGVTWTLLRKVDRVRWGKALTPIDEDITISSYRGLVINERCKIKKFHITAGTPPTGSGIVVGMQKNNVTITTVNATILPNNRTSASNSTQPSFSSDTFEIGDRIDFFIPAGGIGSVNAGQNLEVYLEFELL